MKFPSLIGSIEGGNYPPPDYAVLIVKLVGYLQMATMVMLFFGNKVCIVDLVPSVSHIMTCFSPIYLPTSDLPTYLPLPYLYPPMPLTYLYPPNASCLPIHQMPAYICLQVFSLCGFEEPPIWFKDASENKMAVFAGIFILNALANSLTSTGAFEIYVDGK